MLVLGFTGTREGLTPHQHATLLKLFYELDPTEVHHGDCIGADTSAHDCAIEINAKIVLHPPKDDELRAFCQADEEWPEKDYLARDRDIASVCDKLIACPKEDHEIIRSGTWTTVRYARKLHKPITIIWPNGEIKNETA